MVHGELAGIFLTERKADALRPVDMIEAVAGRGLLGDRYFLPEGQSHPDKEITLIETEALEALARDYQITLPPGEARRNLVTRGVSLNHLVGQAFRVGAVLLRGIRLCEPCGHLEKLTVNGVKQALVHRGGLRAQILQGGRLRVGDVIQIHGSK